MTKTDGTRILKQLDTTMSSSVAKAQEWPGLPVGHVDLIYRDELNAAVRAGLMEIVERPSRVNPARMTKFIRRTAQETQA